MRAAAALVALLLAWPPPPHPQGPVASFGEKAFEALRRPPGDPALGRLVRGSPAPARRLVYDLLEQGHPNLLEAAGRIAAELDSKGGGERRVVRRFRGLPESERGGLLASPATESAGRELLARALRFGEPYFVARARRALGTLLFREGRLDEARDEIARCVSADEGLEEGFSLAWDLFLLGEIRVQAGRLEEGVQRYRRALEIARSLGEERLVLRVAPRLGEVRAAEGRYGDAIRYLQIATGSSDPAAEAQARVRLAGMYSEVGLVADAEHEISRALALLGAGSDPVERGLALVTRGVVLLDAGGREGEALEALQEARTLLEGSAEARAGLADAHRHRGSALLRLGRTREAVGAYREASRLARMAGAPFKLALSLAALGDALSALGRPAEASKGYLEALEAARGVPGLEAAWRAEAGLGGITEAAGRPEEALGRYEEAVRELEGVWGFLGAPSLRARYLGDKLEVYRRAARLQARLGRPGDSFRSAERCKARTLLDLTAARPPAPGPPLRAPGEALRRLASSESRMRFLERRYLVSPTEGLLARLRRARADHQAERLRMELEAPPRLAAAGLGQPPTIEEVRHSLGDREALLEFLVGPGGSSLWVVRGGGGGGARFVELGASQEEIRGWIDALYRPIRGLEAGRLDLANLGFDVRAARALEEALIEPARPLLAGCDLLWIVPDGPLRRLPFALLVTAWERRPVDARELFAQYAGCRFLVEEFALAYLPSAGLLRRPSPPPRRDPALGGAARAVVVGDPRPLPPGAPPLEHARREAIAVGERLEGAEVLLGEAATLERVSSPPPVRLHLAVHGWLDDERPAYSRLALAGTWLHAYQVEGMDLRGCRVVLSACETVGEPGRGEGFMGLTRAFLLAGASSVVASLWVVDDESTALLMRAYQDALATGVGDIRALRAAQIAVLRHGRRSGVRLVHPFFWAAFLHIGI